MQEMTEIRYQRMRCGNGHERVVGFYELLEAGTPGKHVSFIRPALGEVLPSYDGAWRDDGQLARCPCGAEFITMRT